MCTLRCLTCGVSKSVDGPWNVEVVYCDECVAVGRVLSGMERVDLVKAYVIDRPVSEWILTERRGAHGLSDFGLQANNPNDLANWLRLVTH